MAYCCGLYLMTIRNKFCTSTRRRRSLARTRSASRCRRCRIIREQNHVFSGVAEFHSMTFTLLGAKEPERVSTGVVSGNFFDVLGVKPLLGRLIIAADESPNAPPVLVLSYAYWMKEFSGDRSIVGRTFQMNDRVHTVVGVLPPLPDYPRPNDVYMPTSVVSISFRPDDDCGPRWPHVDWVREAEARPFRWPRPTPILPTSAVGLTLAYPKSYPAAAGVAPLMAAVEQELTHSARPTFFILLERRVWFCCWLARTSPTLRSRGRCNARANSPFVWRPEPANGTSSVSCSPRA